MTIKTDIFDGWDFDYKENWSIFDNLEKDDHNLIVEGVNYNKMLGNFQKEDKHIQKIMNKISRNDFPKLFKQEIVWAKKTLKKSNRIVWYLRLVKVSFMQNLYDYQVRHKTNLSNEDKTFIADFLNKEIKIYNKKAKKNKITLSSLKDNPDLKYWQRRLEHSYGLNIHAIDELDPQWELPGEVLLQMGKIETEWKASRKQLIQDAGEDVFIKLDSTFTWFDLHRSSCEKEGDAMGHCGNTPMHYSTDHTILSLREKFIKKSGIWWKPHATFILNKRTGMLGEMKGRGNEKPASKYHKYIIPLLKHKRIKGIEGGGYLPESNFSVLDLPDATMKSLVKKKPDLMEFADQILEYGFTDSIKKSLKDAGLELDGHKDYPIILDKIKDIHQLIQHWSPDHTHARILGHISGDDFISTSSDTSGYDQDYFVSSMKPKQIKKIEEWIQDTVKDQDEADNAERDWLDFIFNDGKDYELLEETKSRGIIADLKEIFQAFDDAERFGIEKEMSDAFIENIKEGIDDNEGGHAIELVIEDEKHILDSSFELRTSWEAVHEEVIVNPSDYSSTPEDLTEHIQSYFEYSPELTSIDEPSYGWSGLDEKYFQDEVNRIIKVLDK